MASTPGGHRAVGPGGKARRCMSWEEGGGGRRDTPTPLPRAGPWAGLGVPAGAGRGAAAEAAGGRFPILPIRAQEPWRR